jgi:hypothetical protein
MLSQGNVLRTYITGKVGNVVGKAQLHHHIHASGDTQKDLEPIRGGAVEHPKP